MTAFIAEANRLGITDTIPSPLFYEAGVAPAQFDDEGLHISGCRGCRDFRNDVREALESERIANMLTDAYYGLDWPYGDDFGIDEDLVSYDIDEYDCDAYRYNSHDMDEARDDAYAKGVADGIKTLYDSIGDSVGLMQARADALLDEALDSIG